MLKFLIYWCFYTSSYYNVEKPLAGVIAIDSTTVTTYIYPYQYVEWDIIDTDRIVSRDSTIQSGVYYLEYNDIHSILTITSKQVEQVILAPQVNYTDRITFKRREAH